MPQQGRAKDFLGPSFLGGGDLSSSSVAFGRMSARSSVMLTCQQSSEMVEARPIRGFGPKEKPPVPARVKPGCQGMHTQSGNLVPIPAHSPNFCALEEQRELKRLHCNFRHPPLKVARLLQERGTSEEVERDMRREANLESLRQAGRIHCDLA